MSIGERLDHDWDAAKAELARMTGRHHQTSAAQAAAAVTINTRTPGGPVSLLTEAKTILHDGLARLEALDEEAVAALEAIKGGNPAAASIYASLAAAAHLPDPLGILSSIDNLLKAFIPPADPAVPSFTPAGPQVAGQA
jgi:hypothetical protein